MKRLTNSVLPTCVLALLTWLLAPGTGHAHGLGAECTQQGGRIEVTAYFDDDTPAAAARVRLEDGHKNLVTDFPLLDVSILGEMGALQGQGPFLAASTLIHGGSVLAAGETDAMGRWGCPVPAPGVYVVFVDAGAGHIHRARITVSGKGADSSSSQQIMPPASDSAEVISDGPSRREFTTIRWGRVFLGLAILGIVAVTLGVMVRYRRGSDLSLRDSREPINRNPTRMIRYGII